MRIKIPKWSYSDTGEPDFGQYHVDYVDSVSKIVRQFHFFGIYACIESLHCPIHAHMTLIPVILELLVLMEQASCPQSILTK